MIAIDKGYANVIRKHYYISTLIIVNHSGQLKVCICVKICDVVLC